MFRCDAIEGGDSDCDNDGDDNDDRMVIMMMIVDRRGLLLVLVCHMEGRKEGVAVFIPQDPISEISSCQSPSE